MLAIMCREHDGVRGIETLVALRPIGAPLGVKT
jgi:hypothetical protein